MSSLRSTVLMDGTLISTIELDAILVEVFDLVLDPLLGREKGKYETMVFLPGKYPKEDRCVRYQTEREAILGHTQIVEEEIRARDTARETGDENLNEDEDPFHLH